VAACTCQGGHCQHHAASEACPNPAMKPMPVVVLETGITITDSEDALCRECWENHAADYHEQ